MTIYDERPKWAHRSGDHYVLITASVVGNEKRSAIEHYLAPGQYPSIVAAVAAGFRDLDRSDDFNIGVVDSQGRLVAILWTDEVVDDEPEVVGRIAVEVGLR